MLTQRVLDEVTREDAWHCSAASHPRRWQAAEYENEVLEKEPARLQERGRPARVRVALRRIRLHRRIHCRAVPAGEQTLRALKQNCHRLLQRRSGRVLEHGRFVAEKEKPERERRREERRIHKGRLREEQRQRLQDAQADVLLRIFSLRVSGWRAGGGR